METPAAPEKKPSDTASRTTPPATGGNLADLLGALDNGIIVTGLVLAADEGKLVTGTSKGGRPYSFANREIQVWTGNRAVVCKFQAEAVAELPGVVVGLKASYKVVGVRMNGNEPQFTVETIR